MIDNNDVNSDNSDKYYEQIAKTNLINKKTILDLKIGNVKLRRNLNIVMSTGFLLCTATNFVAFATTNSTAMLISAGLFSLSTGLAIYSTIATNNELKSLRRKKESIK